MEMIILDLETSGLRAREDSIIEVALMRIDDTGKILEQYSSLVNPGFVISAEITLLTNITPEDLESAPTIGSLKSQIVDFIGNSPVIGHNVSFDLDFLAENGMFPSNPLVIDTFKMAEILYHGEKSLNLSSLTETLGYTHTDAHRAGSDVEATRYLLLAEIALLRALTPTQSAILARAAVLSRSPMLDWMRSLTPNAEDFKLEGESSQLRSSELVGETSTDPKESLRRDRREHSPSWNIFAAHLEHILARDAGLGKTTSTYDDVSKKISKKDAKKSKKPSEKSLPSWSELLALGDLEERPEQSRLVAMTLAHMQTAGHLCAEAPTGIGKTFAYLYPAVITALTTGKQVCISTNTKALQDQIEGKDFPKLTSLFEQAGVSGLELQKLKGRKNYLSLLAYFEFFDQDELSDTAAILAAKLGFWLLASAS